MILKFPIVSIGIQLFGNVWYDDNDDDFNDDDVELKSVFVNVPNINCDDYDEYLLKMFNAFYMKWHIISSAYEWNEILIYTQKILKQKLLLIQNFNWIYSDFFCIIQPAEWLEFEILIQFQFGLAEPYVFRSLASAFNYTEQKGEWQFLFIHKRRATFAYSFEYKRQLCSCVGNVWCLFCPWWFFINTKQLAKRLSAFIAKWI